ncbi:MAG: M14 family metallopeptidase [Erysipelotrichaceae bacterium]|nr:M14 family metallopeptidase [Erysipelotrichaceae bacterium]
MRAFFTRRNIIIILIFAILGIGVFVFASYKKAQEIIPTTFPELNNFEYQHTIIGKSIEGRNINAYTYGKGGTHLIFIGGIHGGYEWNSILLAYQFIDYLEENFDVIPENLTITVIPSANPDGVYRVIGKEGRFTILDVPTNQQVNGTGRLNARDVDLNRNFDCNWKPKSTWRDAIVSAGSKAFSEPEAAAIRDFVLEYTPDGVIFWHSQANAVYASKCEAGILPNTLDIMNAYAQASGYTAVESFDQYDITGDAEGWLASINIPAITVELKTHETIEWEKNLAGIKALFKYYGQE